MTIISGRRILLNQIVDKFCDIRNEVHIIHRTLIMMISTVVFGLLRQFCLVLAHLMLLSIVVGRCSMMVRLGVTEQADQLSDYGNKL